MDMDKLRSVGVMKGGRSRDRVAEGRDRDGNRYKATTDQAGNTVTERAKDRVDVTVRPSKVAVTSTVRNEGQ